MQKHNVLIIAEEQESLQKIKAALEEEYNVITCDNIDKAIEIQKNNDIELIITDLKTNEISALNHIAQNRGANQDFGAMIALTDNPDKKSLLNIVNTSKLFRYILKPWNAADLKVTVKNVIDTYALIVENKHLLERLKENFSMTILMLANAMEARDPFTQGHSERVAYVSKCIARRMNFPEKDLDMLYSACFLHDIGKIGVPGSVFNKPDRLDEEEMMYIKAHTSIATRILSPVPDFAEMIPYIRSHHERMDGKGYPDGLKGEEIPLFSRIMAVADTFDAITSDRPYRTGKSFDVAMKILEEVKGSQLDPQIVDVFLKMLREKEITSIWELE